MVTTRGPLAALSKIEMLGTRVPRKMVASFLVSCSPCGSTSTNLSPIPTLLPFSPFGCRCWELSRQPDPHYAPQVSFRAFNYRVEVAIFRSSFVLRLSSCELFRFGFLVYRNHGLYSPAMGSQTPSQQVHFPMNHSIGHCYLVVDL